MKSQSIAIVIPYTPNHKILLQKRTSISKYGEQWSFFGGSIEKNESKEEAAIREIKEELDFDIKEQKYIGNISKKLKNIKTNEVCKVTYEIFITNITEDLSQFKLNEGDDLKFFTIEEARKLKMTPEIDNETINLFEKIIN